MKIFILTFGIWLSIQTVNATEEFVVSQKDKAFSVETISINVGDRKSVV